MNHLRYLLQGEVNTYVLATQEWVKRGNPEVAGKYASRAITIQCILWEVIANDDC